MKELSIIMPTKDRKDILINTLFHISEQVIFDNNRFEMLVINDGSGDLPYDLFPEILNIRIIECRKHSLAIARNYGAKNACGRVILFLDDDILPASDHFIRHLEIHENFPNVIVGAHREYHPALIGQVSKTPFGRYKIINEYNWLAGVLLTESKIMSGIYLSDHLAGFSCSMHKTLWTQLNGFNERFTDAGCEDSEFFYRAKKAGITLIYDKNNICYHNEPDNFILEKWLHRQGTGIRSAIVMCEIHTEGKTHPTYYLNTPIDWKNDNRSLIVTKITRSILKLRPIYYFFYFISFFLEKIRFPDKVLFRIYNTLWISVTVYYFREKYRSIKKQSPFH